MWMFRVSLVSLSGVLGAERPDVVLSLEKTQCLLARITWDLDIFKRQVLMGLWGLGKLNLKAMKRKA